MRISDWSSDVCSSDLADLCGNVLLHRAVHPVIEADDGTVGNPQPDRGIRTPRAGHTGAVHAAAAGQVAAAAVAFEGVAAGEQAFQRSEEHTSELQSLMRISYAVFCLKKKKDYTKLV